jgi:hypothetical protein
VQTLAYLRRVGAATGQAILAEVAGTDPFARDTARDELAKMREERVVVRTDPEAGPGIYRLAPQAAAPPTSARGAAPVQRPMAEYQKLRATDTWGIAVPVVPGSNAPAPGEKVTVQTKAGKIKTEVVGRVVGPGQTTKGEPATLCTVVREGA